MREIRKPDEILVKFLPHIRPLPGINYVPSQFSLSFVHNVKSYVYNTLTRQCLETEMPERCRAGEGYNVLIENRFLVPEGRDECAWYNSVSALLRTYGRKAGYGGYTILPTLACNARCVYCYEDGMKPVTMTPETVEQTIRYIVDTHRSGSVHLTWFGGEPLLCPDIIDRICEGLQEAGLAYHSKMVSNGSLITPEIIAKMTGLWYLNGIQVSMDGAEGDYIARKRYSLYRDEYQRVMEAISALSEAGIRVAIRCNVDEDNFDRVPVFLDDLKNSVAHKENVKLYLAPLYGIRAGEHDLSIWQRVIEARHMIEAAGFSTTSLAKSEQGYRINRCMADGGGVVIGPDGSLYPCEHCPSESRFGDIWHGVTDENARKEFCRVDRTREKCRTCPFLPDCTSFASCPIQDYQCREVHEMLKIAYLRRLIDNLDSGNPDIEEEQLFC